MALFFTRKNVNDGSLVLISDIPVKVLVNSSVCTARQNKKLRNA